MNQEIADSNFYTSGQQQYHGEDQAIEKNFEVLMVEKSIKDSN